MGGILGHLAEGLSRDLRASDLRLLWWRPVIVAISMAVAMAWRMWNATSGAFPLHPELITGATLLAALLLKNHLMWVIPPVVALITDLALGLTWLAPFTVSAWVAIGFVAVFYRHSPRRPLRYVHALAFALTARAIYFLWTNFGAWLIYNSAEPLTLRGLLDGYDAALPFMWVRLAGNVVTVLVAVAVVGAVERHEESIGLVPAMRRARSAVAA